MILRAKNERGLILSLAGLFSVAGLATGREKLKGPEFKYVGGTENVIEGCKGNLELAAAALAFKCSSGFVSVPYSSITVMQYRSNISREVRKLKLKWKVKPPSRGGTRNHYFTVLFSEDGATRALVLAVSPQAMRPYLAEIDLKSGKRIEVQSHEEYD